MKHEIRSICPRDTFAPTRAATLNEDSLVAYFRDGTHALRHRVEARMFQKPSHHVRKIVEAHIEDHQSVGRMAQPRFAEVRVLREKRHPPQSVEDGNDVTVIGTAHAPIMPEVPRLHAHPAQQRGLVFGKIFVEEIHAAWRLGLRVAALCQSACAVRRASSTASAIAGKETRPPHRSALMNSHDFPAATSARTWWTMMRVPRNVGLPWQTRGLAAMYRPSSTICSFVAVGFAAFIARRLVAETITGKTAFR